GSAFDIECRGHSVVCDQPVSNGGEDAGLTPPEFFAGSLAACVGYYVSRYCEQAKIDTAGLKVDCDWQTAEQPKRIVSFALVVCLPQLPEKRKKAVARVASSCLIHATLGQSVSVDIIVESKE
ncbi:MAG: OsmC family protein, partial [Mariprofundus sp.]